MAFSPTLNTSLMALAAMSSREHCMKLDTQNYAYFANWYINNKSNGKKITNKLNQEGIDYMMFVDDWQDILGYGFTTRKPEWLQKKHYKFSTIKYKKLFKVVYKRYKKDGWTVEMINQECKLMLEALSLFISFVSEIWEQDKTQLTKLDKKYYQYAKKLYCGELGLDPDDYI